MRFREKLTHVVAKRKRLKLVAFWIGAFGLTALLFGKPLAGWFMLDSVGPASEAVDGSGSGQGGGVAEPRYPDETFESFRRAFASYEKARALLAADSLDGLALHAEAIERVLARTEISAAEGASSEVAESLADGAAAARRLAAARSIEDARNEFAQLSRSLLSLGASDARLRQGWSVFACPMKSGFNKWMQPGESLSNPYMGMAMPTCGSPSEWDDALPEPVAGEAAYYTCSMHPSVKQEGPGTCPICSMDLTPVTHEELASGVIRVDPVRIQKIGVRFAEVERRPLAQAIRAVGRTTFDESRVRDFTLKLSGWIETLYVSETGQPVRRGEPILALYSPELHAAQEEFLLALESQRRARGTGAPDRADYLVRAARKRLSLWDLSDRQIEALARRGEPLERVPFHSPYSGFVVTKDVNEGAAVRAGERILRIAALDSIWVEADLYEADLARVHVGDAAHVELSYLPGSSFEGKVSYIYPWLDPTTRTGRVRIELPNRDLELRPDMYADVEIRTGGRGAGLAIPSSAVLDTGRRQIVFLDLGEGRFKPQTVEIGARNSDWLEVLSGLQEGDRIVASANFLISSESRIRAAEEFWGGDDDAE